MSNSGLNPLNDHVSKRGEPVRHAFAIVCDRMSAFADSYVVAELGGKRTASSDANESARHIVRPRQFSRLGIGPGALEPGPTHAAAPSWRPQHLPHLISAAMPALPGCICGSTADDYARGWTVLYFYNGQSPHEPSSNPDDIALHTAYSHHHYDLTAMRASVAGVSTEPAEVQRKRRTKCEIPHDLLSDPELRLASALHLPTRELNGHVVYEPLTLVMRDGIIHCIFYPIDDESRHVGEVVAWIQICSRGTRR